MTRRSAKLFTNTAKINFLKFTRGQSTQGKAKLRLFSILSGFAMSALGVQTIFSQEAQILDESSSKPVFKNLVFKGGGLKGFAYVDALLEFQDQLGSLNEVERVAGASIGAVTAALLAVGYTPSEMNNELLKLQARLSDFIVDKEKGDFKVNALIMRAIEIAQEDSPTVVKGLKAVGTTLSHAVAVWRLFSNKGSNPGDAFREFLDDLISTKVAMLEKGAQKDFKYLTFGELKTLKEKAEQKGLRHYKDLYVVGALYDENITRNGILSVIVYSAENPEMKHYVISDAVRLSASFPYIFKPHGLYFLAEKRERKQIERVGDVGVDGGIIHNYPITIFDCNRYLTHPFTNQDPDAPIENFETLGFLLNTPLVVNAWNFISCTVKTYMRDQNTETPIPSTERETLKRDITIDPRGVSTFDLALSSEKIAALKASGKSATKAYFRTESRSLSRIQKDKTDQAKKINATLMREHAELTNLPYFQVNAGYIVPDEYFTSIKPHVTPKTTLPSELKTIWITGISGTGKSQLAFHTAQEYLRDHFWFSWRNGQLKDVKKRPIIWVINSDNLGVENKKEQVIKEIGLFATTLMSKPQFNGAQLPRTLKEKIDNGISLNPDERKRLIHFTHEALLNNPGWMLVFNQADGTTAWLQEEVIIPRGATYQGICVFSTQDGFANTPHAVNADLTSGLSLEKAKQFFDKADEKNDPTELIEFLHRLPFAIAAARDYMIAEGISCASYLESYKRDWKTCKAEGALKDLSPDSPKFRQHIAIRKSAERIFKESDKTVSRLLYFCALLPSDNIDPVLLLKLIEKYTEQGAKSTIIEDKLRSALEKMGSMVTPVKKDSSEKKYRMHSLVQEVIQDVQQAKSEKERADEDQVIMQMLDLVCIDRFNDKKNYRRFLELQPSFSAVCDYYNKLYVDARLKVAQESVHNLAALNHDEGSLYATVGEISKAEGYYLRALKLFDATHGEDHIKSANTLNNLGNLYQSTDRVKSESYYLRALKLYDTTYGENHIVSANTLSNFGNLYQSTSKPLKAKEYFERALKIYERDNSSHPDILIIRGNLESVNKQLAQASAISNAPHAAFFKPETAESKVLRDISASNDAGRAQEAPKNA